MNVTILKNKLAHQIKVTFSLFGLHLTSVKSINKLIDQRDKLLSELLKAEGSNLTSGLSGIVFSKDRAMQLYALLDSYKDLVSNKVPLTVIYVASTDEHNLAYGDVRKYFADLNVTFVKESNSFKDEIRKIIDSISTKNIFFLVDDDIFIKSVDLNFAMTLNTTQYVLSLRHSKHLKYSYTSDTKQMPPPLSPFDESNKLQVFEWFICGNEWSDPWSLDGHILSTAEIKILTRVCDFSAPNSYEGELKTFNSIFNDRKGLCYHDSKILNMPINKVQKEFDNVSGSISADYLLKMWMDGYIIDTHFLKSLTPTSTHELHNIEFIKRKAPTSINLNGLE
jgi:hypothetical protein